MAKKETQEPKPDASASKDEQVGFHKGSLSTLAKERQELARIIQIVEQLMQMHLAALKELGVDLEKEAKEELAYRWFKSVKNNFIPVADMLPWFSKTTSKFVVPDLL